MRPFLEKLISLATTLVIVSFLLGLTRADDICDKHCCSEVIDIWLKICRHLPCNGAHQLKSVKINSDNVNLMRQITC